MGEGRTLLARARILTRLPPGVRYEEGMRSRDLLHLRRTLELAELGRHSAHPNPMVGAVVVSSDGELVGEGHHVSPGRPHAEVVALAQAGNRSRGGTLYVNLEPCSHHGRTPPCTDSIIDAGITRLVYAMDDPDPDVRGGGAELLREAGVEVERAGGEESEAARRLNAAYVIHRSERRPHVTYKAAVTLDGRTAPPDGNSRWISGVAAREDAHALRAESDAIGVGIGTILADDPSLTCRLSGYEGMPPTRVVFDTAGRLPREARVLDAAAPTLVVTSARGASELERLGVEAETAVVPESEGGVDLALALGELASRGIVALLLEGGSTLAGSFVRAGLVDRMILYQSCRVFGGDDGLPLFGGSGAKTLAEARYFDIESVTRLGEDIRIEAIARRDETCSPG